MADKGTGNKNMLHYGDNLDVLRTKVKDESVDLCYIDPPFNSKRNYNQIYNNVGNEDRAQAQAFTDTWTWDDKANDGFDEILSNTQGRYPSHTVDLLKGLQPVLKKSSLFAYIVSMTQRAVEIHRVLKPTGSFYLHCDPTASHYLKVVMDSVFVAQGGDFLNEIVWRRTGTHSKSTRFAPIHDVILLYTKSSKWTWNQQRKPYMLGHVEENFEKTPDGWKTKYWGNVLTGSGLRGGESGQAWRGVDPSSKGRHWAIPGAVVADLADAGEDLSKMTQHEKLEKMLELGYIKFQEGQFWPVYERMIKSTDGQTVSDIWAYQPHTHKTQFGTADGIDEDVRWLSTQDQERLGYPTQKPEALLERIIAASTNEGDVVLDAYCGCGTTIAVAESMRRRWIGMDITYQAIALILHRMEKAFGKERLDTIRIGGIPQDMASAEALAHKKDDRVRKEFEKWAVLTYSNNRAIINDKKGADGGIDGIAYSQTGKNDTAKVVFQVKSGGVGRGDIAKLRGDMEREGAALAVFITLQPPSGPMLEEAHGSGRWTHAFFGRTYDRVQIVTIQEMLEGGKRLDLPLSIEVVKSAQKAPEGEQQTLF